jgi:hypothetical protein
VDLGAGRDILFERRQDRPAGEIGGEEHALAVDAGSRLVTTMISLPIRLSAS